MSKNSRPTQFYATVSTSIVLVLISLFLLMFFHSSNITNIVKENINILDISQTILGDIFDMVLICDMEKAKGSLKEVQDELGALGKELGVDVRAQLADIFYAMHRI